MTKRRHRVVIVLQALSDGIRVVRRKTSDGLDYVANLFEAMGEGVRDGDWRFSRVERVGECMHCLDTGVSRGGWTDGHPCTCAMGVMREAAEKAGIVQPAPYDPN